MCSKRTKMGMIGVMLFTVVSFVATGVAFAGWFNKSPEERAAKMVERLTDELKLNPEQQALLKKSVEEVTAKAKELRPDHEAMMDMAKEQILAGKIDKVRVKSEMTKHHTQMEAVMDLGLEKADAFLATLTPEQRQLLVKHLEDMKGRHGCGWFGHGPCNR